MRVQLDDACKNIGAADKRPCFFKIMWPNNSFDLRIPPAFKEHIASEGSDKAKLRTALGTWDLGLRQDDEGDAYFARGWPKFVKDHSLGDLEFLVFKYNGNMSFDVVIFDKLSGCARNYNPSTSHQEPAASSNFTSSFPHFICRLKETNLGSKCTLSIPKAFSEEHLCLAKRTEMVLKTSEGTCWSVKVNTCGEYKYPVIIAGWKAFADANELKIGDTCVFELIDKKMFQVRILN